MSISIPIQRHRLPLALLVLFCILVGLTASLWGYSYIGGNQVEQLPLVMRAIDPGYLVNDFMQRLDRPGDGALRSRPVWRIGRRSPGCSPGGNERQDFLAGL